MISVCLLDGHADFLARPGRKEHGRRQHANVAEFAAFVSQLEDTCGYISN